jgi:hypothetical protein
MIKDVIKLISFGVAFLIIAGLTWSYLYEIFRDKKLRKQFLKKNSEPIATDRASSSSTAAPAIDGGGSGIDEKSKSVRIRSGPVTSGNAVVNEDKSFWKKLPKLGMQ